MFNQNINICSPIICLPLCLQQMPAGYSTGTKQSCVKQASTSASLSELGYLPQNQANSVKELLDAN